VTRASSKNVHGSHPEGALTCPRWPVSPALSDWYPARWDSNWFFRCCSNAQFHLVAGGATNRASAGSPPVRAVATARNDHALAQHWTYSSCATHSWTRAKRVCGLARVMEGGFTPLPPEERLAWPGPVRWMACGNSWGRDINIIKPAPIHIAPVAINWFPESPSHLLCCK
jgi:hypothetical protein